MRGLDATIVIPAIVIVATLIVGWILAYLDIREYKQQIRDLTNDFWQEKDLTVRLTKQIVDLKDRIYWLEKLQPRGDLSTVEKPRKRIETSAGEGSQWHPQS